MLSNYRPISVLPILSKILKSLILSRLTAHLNKNDIIIPKQFGFQKNHNTTLQLARIIDIISTATANKKLTSLVSLDIEKAFDTV